MARGATAGHDGRGAGDRFAAVRASALPLLLALAALAVPALTDDRYVLKVLAIVGVYVIVVTGMSLLFGYAGQISLGHAAFVGIGAYASGYLTKSAHWPWLAAVAAAVALAALGGLLLALPSLRLTGHYLAMATLGFGQIASIVFVEAKSFTGGVDGMSGIPLASIGAYQFRSAEANYLLVWGTALLALVLAAGIASRRPGRAMRALRATELGALACGVDTVRVKVEAFVISAALGGLAGALYAHVIGFISPSTFSLDMSITLIAMVVLGGTRSLLGPALGAVALTLLHYPDVVAPGLPRTTLALLQSWEADVYGVVLIAVMLLAPDGLAGVARALRSRRRPAAVPDVAASAEEVSS